MVKVFLPLKVVNLRKLDDPVQQKLLERAKKKVLEGQQVFANIF